MILFTKAFVADGKTFATLEEAQQAAVLRFFKASDGLDQPNWRPEQIAATIVGNRDEIMDILTTTESSRPAARKVNGGTKKRKLKAAATSEPQLAIDPAI